MKDLTLDEKIAELKEAINKFFIQTKDDSSDQVNNITGKLESLMASYCMNMNEEEYDETYSSYYESMC